MGSKGAPVHCGGGTSFGPTCLFGTCAAGVGCDGAREGMVRAPRGAGGRWVIGLADGLHLVGVVCWG